MLFIAYNRFLSIFQFINRIVTIFAFWVPSSFLYLTKLEGFVDISSKKKFFFFFYRKRRFFGKMWDFLRLISQHWIIIEIFFLGFPGRVTVLE